MIERLWNSLVGRHRNLLLRAKAVQPQVWIVLAVTLLVCARGLRALHQHHIGRLDADIATATGSIRFFYGTPQPDDSGSSVLYLQSSEKGIGLFRSDVATGEREAAFEKPLTDYPDCV